MSTVLHLGNAVSQGCFLRIHRHEQGVAVVEHYWRPERSLAAVSLPDGMVFAVAYPEPMEAAKAETRALIAAERWLAAAERTEASR